MLTFGVLLQTCSPKPENVGDHKFLSILQSPLSYNLFVVVIIGLVIVSIPTPKKQFQLLLSDMD